MKKLFLLFAIVLMFSGCAWFETPNEMEKTAEMLAVEGSEAFVAGDYRDAAAAYTRLRDWYPFSKYSIVAELKIADTHYHLENYDEAILGYEEFEKMHPKNEVIPYVIYQTGLCWFDRLDSIDRDHTPAKNSLIQFKRLIVRYPGNEYAQKAKANIPKCLDNMSGHELYVADYYMKMEKYIAALKRYEYFARHYPNAEESKEVLDKIARCREFTNIK